MKQMHVIAMLVASMAIALPASALCVGTTCTTVSIDYTCETSVLCSFDASGSHTGVGAVSGVLTVSGSAIPAEKLEAACSGVASCDTGLAGEATAGGCAVVNGETSSVNGIYASTDADVDCDDDLDFIILDLLNGST